MASPAPSHGENQTSARLGYSNPIFHWQVHRAVMHINHGNPALHEVVVDFWPEFKVVLTRPQQQVQNW